MKNKYAFYCSGSASRIIKYYEQYSASQYKVEFIYYDGKNEKTIIELRRIFKDKLMLPEAVNTGITGINKQSFSDNMLELLKLTNVNYLFCFGTRFFKGAILDVYKNKIINFHPSILPSFPGLNAIDQALDSGSQILGNTAHFIDKGIDTGPIIMQSAINRAAVNNYEDVLELQLLMLEKIWTLLENDCIQVIEGKVMIKTNVEKNILMSI